MLFSKKDDKDDKAKKGSIFGLLFNPKVGDDIKPIRESWGMFPRMIAMIFAMNGMFPKDHPALKDQSLPFSVREVINTAWETVSFTREGLPNAVLFIAVTGMIGFSALFLLAFILSLFMGSAHAASASGSGSMFDPAGPLDWGNNWIKNLFYGEAIPNPGGENAASGGASCPVQSALGKALGFYSNGVLVLAGIILLYYVVRMITDTAQSGKFMGNANQIWGPIRLVIAIGLLVPIASGAAGNHSGCTIVGLNTGQYLVAKIAQFGSGFASQAWSHFLTSLSTSSAGNCVPGSPSCNNVSIPVRQKALHMIENYMCVELYNKYAEQGGLDKFKISLPKIASIGEYTFDPEKKPLSMTFRKVTALCGGFKLTEPVQNGYEQVYTARSIAFKNHLSEFHAYAKTAVAALEQHLPPPDVEDVLLNYQKDIYKEVRNALTAADIMVAGKADSLNNDEFKDLGWLAAGSWFNIITRIQSNRSGSVQEGGPEVLVPMIHEYAKKSTSLSNIYDATLKDFGEAKNRLSLSAEETSSTEGLDVAGQFNSKSLTAMATKGFNPVNMLLNTVDVIGGSSGVWDSGTGELAIKFDKTKNPLGELAAWGQNNVATAMNLVFVGGIAKSLAAAMQAYKDGLAAKLADTATLGAAGALAGGTVKLMDLYGDLLITVSVIFFMMGFGIGFLVPLIPFYRFFFGSITWIISVFEAFVAAPLFALAHLSPYADGLPGNAKSGYIFILHLFTRPILMIFGLVAGYLVFGIAVSFLNQMFIVAAVGVGGFSGSIDALAKIVYSVVYCLLVFMLANQCFKTIGFIPQQAMSWLGGSSREEKVGDPSILGATAIAGYIGKDYVPKIAGAPAGIIAGSGKYNAEEHTKRRKAGEQNIVDTQTQEASAATAQSRQNQQNYNEAMARKAGLNPKPVLGPDGKPTNEIDYD